MAAEIERKWVTDPDAVPELGDPGTPMRQGYLAEEGTVSVRLRVTTEGARLTVKAGTGVSRAETEVAISAVDAEELWPFTEGRRVEKVRHRLPFDGVVAEIDHFGGALEGLCLVEVEFESLDAAEAFTPPTWFGREVTDDGQWTNASLARYGRPEA